MDSEGPWYILACKTPPPLLQVLVQAALYTSDPIGSTISSQSQKRVSKLNYCNIRGLCSPRPLPCIPLPSSRRVFGAVCFGYIFGLGSWNYVLGALAQSGQPRNVERILRPISMCIHCIGTAPANSSPVYVSGGRSAEAYLENYRQFYS